MDETVNVEEITHFILDCFSISKSKEDPPSLIMQYIFIKSIIILTIPAFYLINILPLLVQKICVCLVIKIQGRCG